MPDIVPIKVYVTYKKKFLQMGNLGWGILGWLKDQMIPFILRTIDTHLFQTNKQKKGAKCM
jgi:hypothetical protein